MDTGKQPEDAREAIEQKIAKPQITPVDETKKVDRVSVKEDLKKNWLKKNNKLQWIN